MYRVNPFTYFVEGFLGTALANAKATCDANEYLSFDAPAGSDCGKYMKNFSDQTGGFLLDPSATDKCEYCPIGTTNQFLSYVNIDFANRWRNWGFMWVFIIFNLGAAVFFFWLARVPKTKKSKTG